MRRLLRLLGVLGMVALIVPSAPMAHASSTICVALVVDDADLGGGVHTSCAKVPAGATGYDVLRAGGHTFTVCSNGVLGTIDGKPADGCHVKDNSHYWSYWHRAPGASASAWTYSDEGAGTYQPRNMSTEGWAWQNGASRKPSAVPYSSICRPAATPSPTATQRPPSHHAVTSPAATVRPATGSPTPRPKTPHLHASAAASSAPSTNALSASAPTSTGASTRPAVAAPHPHSASGPPAALLAGVGLAAAIGAGAFVLQRRSR